MRRVAVFILVFLSAGAFGDDPLQKAKTLRSNGLLTEAKKELVDVLFSSTSPESVRADALLLLGEIAVDEKKFDAARENWTKVLQGYPDSAAATAARAKLDLLTKMGVPASPDGDKQGYRPGTILVLPDEDYAWAHVEIADRVGRPCGRYR